MKNAVLLISISVTSALMGFAKAGEFMAWQPAPVLKAVECNNCGSTKPPPAGLLVVAPLLFGAVPAVETPPLLQWL